MPGEKKNNLNTRKEDKIDKKLSNRNRTWRSEDKEKKIIWYGQEDANNDKDRNY